MAKTLGMRWLVLSLSATMLLLFASACTTETIEVPGETVVVEKIVKETVEVPGETVVVEKIVKETVEVPGETVVVEKEVVKTVEVVKAVPVEVVKEVRSGYVVDPSTGNVVSPPEYGGTLTYTYRAIQGGNVDPAMIGIKGMGLINLVNEKLGIVDWATPRDKNALNTDYIPLEFYNGHLAESWETPDPLTYIFNIREGVKWHDKAPMNGRELTAHDIVYNYNRYNGSAGFDEPQWKRGLIQLPIESIEATDDYTMVVKLTQLNLYAIRDLLQHHGMWILAPDVIEQNGNYSDWRNVVGTGPYELADYVDGSSVTHTKIPNYWGYDEKFPENRLPYYDELKALNMPEEATRLAGLRSGKVDVLTVWGGADLKSVDAAKRVQETNPEVNVYPFFTRSDNCFGLNRHLKPFDDIRVRQAMQMAIDVKTIDMAYFKGMSMWKPMGQIGEQAGGSYLPFEEWPEELQSAYTYNPERAAALLDEAGYPLKDGTRFKVTLTFRNIYDLGYTEIAAGYFEALGIKMDIDSVDSAGFSSRRKDTHPQGTPGNFEMISGGAGRNQHNGHTQYSNYEVYAHPEWTALADKVVNAPNFEERHKAAVIMDQWSLDQHFVIWGPKAPRFQVVQPWVVGFNGELKLGLVEMPHIFARLWTDWEMRGAMGN